MSESSDTGGQASDESSPVSRLLDLALLFLRLGATALGGPAAHIAMMEQEIVRRRKWLSHDAFLDLLGATNLIPGPNSTEMAIHIGYLRAGWAGLLVSGLSFIAPAFFIVLAIANLYVQYGTLPSVQGVLYGVKPVVIAVIVQALWGLSRTAIRTKLLGACALLCGAVYLSGVSEVALLLLTGTFVSVARWCSDKTARETRPLILLLAVSGAIIGLLYVASTLQTKHLAFSSGALFWYFAKIGSVLYGSGYVLLAFIRSDLVEHWHWLTSSQLLDATAVGQITPGPVFTTATFIGYVLDGPRGGLVATAGIFLPAFVFVALSGAVVSHIRKSKLAGAFLDGVNVAALVLMAVVTFQLGRGALKDVSTFILAAISTLLLFRFQINSVWLILGGAAIGLLLKTTM